MYAHTRTENVKRTSVSETTHFYFARPFFCFCFSASVLRSNWKMETPGKLVLIHQNIKQRNITVSSKNTNLSNYFRFRKTAREEEKN